MNLIVSLLLGLLVLGAVLVIIVDRGEPGGKLAWLLVIALLPVIGLVLYILIGINYRHHWFYNARHQCSREAFDQGADDRLRDLLFGHAHEEKIREEFRPLVRLLQRGSGMALTDGNSFEVITNGQRKYELLMQDLREARESIHMEYFRFGRDKGSREVKRLLMEKAREGVKVRFLNENVANLPISTFYYDAMKKAGVEVVKFSNPRYHLLKYVTKLNYRNHRKIVVIDGRIGYTGGMSINDHYFHQWRDTHLRIVGDAVAALQTSFLDSWLTARGTIDRPVMDYFPMLSNPTPVPSQAFNGKLMQVVPDEPEAEWPTLLMATDWIVQHARRYVYLQTPYFVPPVPLLDALKSAALSGVDVRLMLSRRNDTKFMEAVNRSFYAELLEAGVKIFEYETEFMHCKTLLCDDYLTSIGTANLDYRSFNINYEVNTYIFDEPVAAHYLEIFRKDMDDCSEVTLDDVARYPWYKVLWQNFLRLFSSIL
ncbi:MAG: cardiolipin synthase [Bacteroidales bacterium]|nr:cardiolipin synthase [Bacteroidales bacterium]